MRKTILVVTLFTLCLFGSSCSGAGNAPLTPSNDKASDSSGSLDNLPIIGGTSYADGNFQALGLMGAYELSIDPVTMTADLVAKRTPTLGQSWTVSGGAFFSIAPCADCLKIEAISLTMDNYLQLHWRNRHPFPLPIPTDPPSASNRLDLHVFDLAAVIVPIGATPEPFPLIGTDAYAGVLIDNAGYTTELANLIGDDAAMPYALIIDDNKAGTDTFNQFNMGIEANFDTFFNLASGGGSLDFDVYLSFGYGQSAVGKNQRLTPQYYNPEFNRKQAWKVLVTPPPVSDTWSDDDTTTPYIVKVEAFDWQHNSTSISNPPQNSDDIAFASKVSSVTIEIPTLTGTPLPSVTTPLPGGTGAPDNPLVFNVPVIRKGSAGPGEHIGLVKVTDSRVPTATPPGADGIDFLIHTPDGIDLVNYALPEYATYQTFVATVVSGNLPPTANIHLSANSTGNGVDIIADPGTSSDPEGDICSYEYDFTNDGIWDETQNKGDLDFGNPVTIPVPCNTTPNPVDQTVALKVTDCGSTPLFSTDSGVVTVGTKLGPPGDLVVTSISRGGTNSALITGVTFDWEDVGCAAQYLIERGDGYLGTGWAEYATSTTSTYTFVPNTTTGIDLDNDFRFRVKARVQAGVNGANDSDPSEEAFILTMSNGGYSSSNQWIHYREPTSSYFNFNITYSTSYNYDGWPPGSTPYSLYAYAYTMLANDVWAVTRSGLIPDLVGQTEAYCDGYWYFNYTMPSDMGLTVGTLSEIPTNYQATLCDYHPSNSPRGSYFQYNLQVPSLQINFCLSSPQNGWCNNSGGLNWQHVSYNLTDLLDGPSGTRDYIAFGMAKGAGTIMGLSNAYSDAWIFVVY